MKFEVVQRILNALNPVLESINNLIALLVAKDLLVHFLWAVTLIIVSLGVASIITGNMWLLGIIAFLVIILLVVKKLQPEKEKPQEESIKDEIGDEFKPKTEQQKQEERQVESMWQNRFQSWDRNTVNLPNSAKRKEEAVRVMQDIERERREQDREQQMQDNEQEQMRR